MNDIPDIPDWKDRRNNESFVDYTYRLYSEMERMEYKFAEFNIENSNLRESLKDTKNKYEQLKMDYAKLSANPYSIDALQRECNELRGKNASLENIKERYESLVEKYNDLESKYNESKSEYYMTNSSAYDHISSDFDPFLFNKFRNEFLEATERGDMVIDLKGVFLKYQFLQNKLESSEEHSKALQHVINDIDRDSSCGDCLYKNHYKNSEDLLESSEGYKSYEELHADVDKYLYTEGELKRGKLPTLTDHLITEAVKKYEFLKGLFTLVFLVSPIVLSWNFGPIYLLLFIPLLAVRLLPSEETLEVFLVEYYKRKEN